MFTITFDEKEMAFMREMLESRMAVSMVGIETAFSWKTKILSAKRDKPSGAVADSIPETKERNNASVN